MADSVTDSPFAVKRAVFWLVLLLTLTVLAPADAGAQTAPKKTAPRTGTAGRVVRKRVPPPVPATTHHSFKLGLALWGENIRLLTADGRTEEIDVKYSGAALGYELAAKWTHWGLWSELQALILDGQATSAGNSITYRSKVKTNIPFIADGGAAYFPHDNVSLSLGAGVLFHSLNLEPPTSVLTTYEFKYSAPLKYFGAFKLNWYMQNGWSFEQKIMAFGDSQIDTGWSGSFNYMF